mgnify:CR=1 FL=1
MGKIDKIVEQVKTIRYQDGDTLIVQVEKLPTKENLDFIKKTLEDTIPHGLNVKILIIDKNIELKLLRKEKE